MQNMENSISNYFRITLIIRFNAMIGSQRQLTKAMILFRLPIYITFEIKSLFFTQKRKKVF